MFEFAPDAYLVTDLQGNIQEANSAVGKLFKRRPQSLEGVPLAMFVSRKEHRKFYVRLASLKNSGVDGLQDWQITLCTEHGGQFPAAVTVRVVRDADGHFAQQAVEVQMEPAWTDLGHALGGEGAAPELAALGSLQPGTDMKLLLTGAPPGGVGWLALGLGELNAPFMGG